MTPAPPSRAGLGTAALEEGSFSWFPLMSLALHPELRAVWTLPCAHPVEVLALVHQAGPSRPFSALHLPCQPSAPPRWF